MKDLLGFDRRKWKTGFTRYRYAIPALAGSKGRAIYNDVDQIYLADPAELFDLDMNGKGQLGINESENSVMLLDCDSMSRIWEYSGAQHGKKHRDFRAAVHAAGLWGLMPGVWNARDAEYVAGESKLLHFTTLQTQPWQPFPHQLKYEDHPLSEVWSALEREADAVTEPTLFVVEAPMGEGKTEAALLLADQVERRLGARGMFFGLPTQATANQMFGRILNFLERTRPTQRSTARRSRRSAGSRRGPATPRWSPPAAWSAA
jgi:hypothetical protein